jgi:hypothetical protein
MTYIAIFHVFCLSCRSLANIGIDVGASQSTKRANLQHKKSSIPVRCGNMFAGILLHIPCWQVNNLHYCACCMPFGSRNWPRVPCHVVAYNTCGEHSNAATWSALQGVHIFVSENGGQYRSFLRYHAVSFWTQNITWIMDATKSIPTLLEELISANIYTIQYASTF